MKQTNNAIKFLMAQYRAIFKNANIAMVSAMAAAALAAGQAQAGAMTDVSNVASDTTITITGNGSDDGSTDNKWESLTLGNDAKLGEGVTGVKFVVQSGAANTLKGTVNLTGASLNLAASGATTAAQAKLVVGEDGTAATVNLTDVTIDKGTLEVGTAASTVKNAVSADTITVGKDGASDGDAVLSVLKSGSVTAGNLTVNKGADLTIGESASVAGNKIIINDGKVNVSGANASAVFGSATSTIEINSGTIVDAAAASGKLVGSTITLAGGTIQSANKLTIDASAGSFIANGGEIKVDDGKSMTIKGTASINDGAKLTNSGTLVLTGKTTITDAATLTLGTNAITQISGDEQASDKTSTLTVSKAVFAKLTKEATQKVKASGAAGTTAILNFTDAKIGLVDAGVLQADGSLDANVEIAGDGKLRVFAEEIDFKNAAINAGKFEVAANTLNVGTADSFVVSGGAALEVGKTLNVVDAASPKELKITEGSVSLKGAAGSVDNVVNASVITVGSSTDSKSGTLSVSQGEWTVKSLVMDSGTATVINDAVLKITGDLTTKDQDNQLVAQDTATIDASKAGTIKLLASGTKLENASTLVLDSADVFDGSGDVIKAAFADNAVEGSANSTINIVKDGELATISRDKFEKFSTASGFKGLWGVKVDGLVSEGTTEMNIGGADNNIIAGLGTGYENVQAKVYGSKPIDNNYSAGSVALTSGTELTFGNGSMTLQNANAHDNDGMFVSKPGAASGDKATLAGVKFDGTSTADSSITLVGSGKIGAITAQTAGSGSVTFGAGEGKTGDVTVEGAIGLDTAEIGKLVTNGSNVTIASGDVFVQEIDFNGGSFNVAAGNKLVLGDGQTFDAQTNAGLASTIDGNLTAGTLTFKASTTGSVDIAGNAVVDLGKLTGIQGIKINVGKDGVENGSATLLADKLELAQATLKIDPAYDQPYASAIAMDLSGASGDTLDGHVEVGHNALFAVGFDTKAEVDAVLGTLVKNGSFADPAPSEPAPGPGTRSSVTAPDANAVVTPNAVVLNKGITFGTNGGIYVGTDDTKTATSNKLEVEAGSALVVTDKVFTVDPATGKKNGYAISGSSATAAIAKDAKLVLVGAFNGADNELNILSGFTGADTQLQNFNVSIGGSDLLEATWTTGGKLDVNLTQDKAKLASAFAGASTPVKQLMLDMLDGSKFAYSTAEGYQLINTLAMANNGTAADAAAHAATYAGAQQAAVASVTTMADAMFGRVGAVGVEAASIAATGSQANGGVWLTPMYKSVDSDGFNAEGASYGSDVDLSGVAFGADTVNGNMRFGAVFNIGSGDAEGKGNGNGLKDEFDYYGFGIYSAMGFGNFALVGDASMTVVSHEVEGLDLKGKADTTAVTMGVTGQYTVATPAVDVTPHLGARFIRLNTDSYDLTSANGVVGTTDFDVQNVFSVPLGVTLSKAFVAGGWSLAPSADLTIAFNTGDTDANSTTRFTGINQNLDLTAEVLDEVQYGLTVGLGAQYGAFGTSFGINYTGSENTDAFGVNAQCRYMF